MFVTTYDSVSLVIFCATRQIKRPSKFCIWTQQMELLLSLCPCPYSVTDLSSIIPSAYYFTCNKYSLSSLMMTRCTSRSFVRSQIFFVSGCFICKSLIIATSKFSRQALSFSSSPSRSEVNIRTT